MKKLFLAAVSLSFFLFQFSFSQAQPGRHKAIPHVSRHTVVFESHHGEAFTVYVDGDVMNRMPQTRVMVADVSHQSHEVVVVLSRPAQKAAVLALMPGEAEVTVHVDYDARLGRLALYTPSCNLVHAEPTPPPVMQPNVTPPPVVREPDFQAMLKRMKGESFDSDRLALGKVIVASSHLTAEQMGRLAATLDYSSSQVELLKYAYRYCIDPQNYFKAVEILTFSTDKKKVMDYISGE